MIKVGCKCGKSIKARNEYAGRKLKCPNCSAVIQIPQAAGAPTKRSSPANTAKVGETKSAKSKPAAKKKKRRRKAAAPENDDGAVMLEEADDDAVMLEEAGDDDAVELEEYSEEDEYGYDDGGYDDYAAPPMPTPRKKKKAKRKSKKSDAATQADSSEGLPKKWLYTMVGAAAVVVFALGALIVNTMIGAGKEHAAAMALPTEFKKFTHKHGNLAADYPAGWILKSGGGTGGVPNWVSFENEIQEVKITVRGSMSGTSMSDIATSGGGIPIDLGGDVPDDLAPVAGVHQFQKDKISAEYNAYEESEPRKIDSGFGEGRISDFTAKNTFSSEYGVRATLIANQYQYNVICTCPKSRLEEYKPVFEKIISSIGSN